MSNPTPDSTPIQLSFDDLEEWRDIPGYEGLYAVSDLGRVKRLAGSKLAKGRILKADRMLNPSPDSGGYMGVKLCFKRWSVHRLVMLAFVGPAPDMDVNHINMIRNDNRLVNLEYLTHAENMIHSAKSKGRLRKDYVRSQTRLTEKDIPSIRRSADDGRTIEDIAEEYGVTRKIIIAIVYKFTWRHVK